MGIGNFFKRQLASVIEWTAQSPELLLYRYPVHDELKDASKLIVGPGQGCMLVYEGKVTDVLSEEGIYLLETDNHPFITSLLKLRQLMESEHKLHLYFYRRAEVVNMPWGTPAPLKYMDNVYRFPVELGVNGNYSFRLDEPEPFFRNIAGAQNEYTITQAQSLMLSRILQSLSSYFATAAISYRNIDAQLDVLSAALTEKLAPVFLKTGFTLTDFQITGTSFDQDTQSRIDKIADITAESIAAGEGGLTYVELEKLKALRDAARNEGGLAGAGLQLGVGAELGRTFNEQKDKVLEGGNPADPVTQLQKLKLLLNEELITQQEFDEKKKEILSRM